MNTITKHRIAITLVLALGLVVATSVRRGSGNDTEFRQDRFWATKLTWNGLADCVIAGDSRACRGLAPESISSVLKDRRVLNFAFDSCGFSEEYLRAIEDVLDRDSGHRSILLGITPYSLTSAALKHSEFEYRREWLPYQSMVGLYAKESLRFLRPMRVDQIPELLIRPIASEAASDHEFGPDGWLALARLGGDTTVYVQQYRDAFYDNQVRPEIVDNLLQQVNRWHASGIRVYGFIPPIAPPIREVEQACSGFNDATFIESFECVGGNWIPAGETDYVTYDGSHLGRDEARRFSRTLAAYMLHAETAQPDGAQIKLSARDYQHPH